MSKSFSVAVLAALIGLALLSSLQLGNVQASTTVIGIIRSNETWTKGNSPYTVTGPVAVDQGVTLTIEPGVTVNLNGYYIQVNGTLTARGTNMERIQFNGQNPPDDNHNCILFMPSSTNWSSQTNSGNIIEYANLTGTRMTINKVSPKISNNYNITHIKINSGAPEISGNTWGEIFTEGDGAKQGLIGPLVISDNTNVNIRLSYVTCNVLRNTCGEIIVGKSSMIINNTAQNSVTGGAIISGNKIVCTTNPTYFPLVGGEVVTNNEIRGMVGGNLIAGNIISGTVSGGNEIVNNTIRGGVTLGANTSIHNNVISPLMVPESRFNPFFGNITISTGAPTVEKNLIVNGTTIIFQFYTGPYTGPGPSPIIRNNTFINNGECVSGPTPSATIIYNNFENCSKTITINNALSVNVPYNWWGTTDQTAIKESIYDYYHNFNLGNVTFIPFLTASNPLAMPDLAAIAGSSPAPTVEPPNNSTTPEQPSQPSNNGTTPESPNKPSDNATTPEPPSEPNNQEANSVVVYQIVIAVLAAMVGVLLAVIGLVFRKRKKQSQSATPTKPVNS